MPELPEMQALAERLDAGFSGSNIESIDILHFSFLRSPFDPVVFHGRSLDRVRRRGKYLLFDVNADVLAVHLSQGGRVEWEEPPKDSRPVGSLCRVTFPNAAILFREYGKERKAGMWLMSQHDPTATLGPEPDSDDFANYIMESDDTRRVHTILRDQHTVAGIGRGYTDDSLWRAQLSPFAQLGKLSGDERSRLLTSIRESLDDALKLERARTGGLPRKMSGRFQIHGHFGEPCPRCQTELARISYESYEAVYCPHCQTDDKLLADRRFSRFVK